MTFKLLISLFFIVWRISSAEDEYINHWLIDDANAVTFCSHDSFMNGTSCVCNPDYNGNFCLNRKCRNFGMDLNSGMDGMKGKGVQDRCICPPGFLGRNCEPVKCVNGANQIYSSLPNEKKISIFASYNEHLVNAWKFGDIGELVCNYTGYWRTFNYNTGSKLLFNATDSYETCKTEVEKWRVPDTCSDDNVNSESGKPFSCQELDMDSLKEIILDSPPNSIVFVVTNMNVSKSQVDGPQTESIIATAIARRIQINVIVYNNTLPLLLIGDPSLTYLQKIASATLGTFVLPSINQNNEQYSVVSYLLENWSNDFKVSIVYSDDTLALPVDQSLELYVAAQTNFNQDVQFNTKVSSVISKTDYWKLYKLENLPPILQISNIANGTQALVYSKGGLIAYSAFTSDESPSISLSDASYSVSVEGASYILVFRLESPNGVIEAANIQKSRVQTKTLTLENFFTNRSSCQFNIGVNAICTSVGASIATIITNDMQSVSFPVYCASADYGRTIYSDSIRKTVDISFIENRQSLDHDFSCANEIGHESYGGRSFVIISQNSKNDNPALSSVDNVFRNKDSIFLQLTDYKNSQNPHYTNYIANLQPGGRIESSDYGVFLTKVMNATSNAINSDTSESIPITELLVETIDSSDPYSDILFVINYPVLVGGDDDVTQIKRELSNKRIKLYALFIQTDDSPKDDAYRYLNNLAVASGGVAIRLRNYTELHQFFKLYYSTLVDNDIVAKAFSENQIPGIALNEVYLPSEDHYLLVTNEDISDSGPVNCTVLDMDNIHVEQLEIIGELQVFKLTPNISGLYNIRVEFPSKLVQLVNVILLSGSTSEDFISLSFLDKEDQNRNDVDYKQGKFTPFLYSSSNFSVESQIFITFSDLANPAKPIYNGSVIPVPGDCQFQNYKYYVNFPWTCSVSGGLYHVKVHQINEGKNLTRTFPITCLGPSSGDCLNNGRKQDEVCVCPLQWTGAHCELPVCLNEGAQTPANTCSCKDSFSGDFCEISNATCVNSPSLPDFRSDLSSLIIVADVQALNVSNLSSGLDITGTPITTIIYGDGNAPRIVQSTTNGQHLSKVLGKPANISTPESNAPNDLYKAINFALDTQLTSRSFIIVYTSNPDADLDYDFLIRLAAKRAEIRVITTQSGSFSHTYQTLALIGNGIPVLISEVDDFENYLKNYVTPIFVSLQKGSSAPQKVFNVFQTGTLSAAGVTVTIPQDSTFSDSKTIAYIQTFNGKVEGKDPFKQIGATNIYQVSFDSQVEEQLQIVQLSADQNAFYSVETIGYLKTAYGFNNETDGGLELLNSGLIYGQQNVISIYSAPNTVLPNFNPANFPYLYIREIFSDGTVSNSTVVLFTRKNKNGCFFKYFAVLNDVCSQNNTIGYQVQLETRTSTLERRQQQFVWTCFKTKNRNGNTNCGGKGSPDPYTFCKCDPGFQGIDCSEPICLNGGILDVSFCRCPPLFYGRRCENSFVQLPTTTVTTATTSTAVPSTSVTKLESTSQSTLYTTTQTEGPSTLSTEAPQTVRGVAFVIDVIGSDDYAFNQTTKSIVEYAKAFNNVHWIMLLGNWNVTVRFGFQKYPSSDALATKLSNFWILRKTAQDTKVASLSKTLPFILDSYNQNGDLLQNPRSLNIFYTTQIGLTDDDHPENSLNGLENFTKSSLVFSTFSKNASQTVLDSLNNFSNNVTNVREYYNGLQTMVKETNNNEDAKINNTKPNFKCVYGLQSNVMVVIDRTPTSDVAYQNGYDFLRQFREGFNYIENDEDRCGLNKSDLGAFYKERTAITAFPYYNNVARATAYCPSRYSIFQDYIINGTSNPDFSDKQVKTMGNIINANDCVCNRFDDESTVKYIIWMPRVPGPVNDTFIKYLRINTTNAYHFVVPFYDVVKTTDLFYKILEDQDPPNADHYLLPNAATHDVTSIVSELYNRLCQSAKVDPTAIPPELDEMRFESRQNYFYN